ncbi:MAG: hypothetical protein A3F72_04170 [Bacteroidetes bacterium RIFCSPLOWO2_12_FULL_35_15]|nr:MAG: hypothetical protein A3F72_04170 [Bacteroidetes bacterium RIFCSPLOWO2_12_FULL_35_15]
MILTGVLIGTNLISANTISQKRIKNEKEILFPLQDSKNKTQADEYKAYRAEQEKKITDNEKKIAELKAKKDKVKKEKLAAYESKIDNLEKKNKEMKKKIMANYKDEGKEKWESFKKEFNHDMDELGQSLKDLFKDNVQE